MILSLLRNNFLVCSKGIYSCAKLIFESYFTSSWEGVICNLEKNIYVYQFLWFGTNHEGFILILMLIFFTCPQCCHVSSQQLTFFLHLELITSLCRLSATDFLLLLPFFFQNWFHFLIMTHLYFGEFLVKRTIFIQADLSLVCYP